MSFLTSTVDGLRSFFSPHHIEHSIDDSETTKESKKRKLAEVETPTNKRQRTASKHSLLAANKSSNKSQHSALKHIMHSRVLSYPAHDDASTTSDLSEGPDDADTDLLHRFINANHAIEHARDQRQLRHQFEISSEQSGSEIDMDDAGQLDDVSDSIARFHLGEDPFSFDTDEEELSEQITILNNPGLLLQQYRRIEPTATEAQPEFSADDLRAAGFQEEHVYFVSLLAHRGRQAILPVSWKRALSHVPHNLFADHDDSAIFSKGTSVFHAEVAFRRMLDLGGSMRSNASNAAYSQRQIKRSLNAYMKWALKDSGLDKRTALPIVRMIIASEAIDCDTLIARARESLQRLAGRYRKAQQDKSSAVSVPAAAYKMPTLYALIVSDKVIALAALQPDDLTYALKPVAIFDFTDPDLDFWSILGLALLICHARNMQIDFAIQTGIGLKQDRGQQEEQDPDL